MAMFKPGQFVKYRQVTDVQIAIVMKEYSGSTENSTVPPVIRLDEARKVYRETGAKNFSEHEYKDICNSLYVEDVRPIPYTYKVEETLSLIDKKELMKMSTWDAELEDMLRQNEKPQGVKDEPAFEKEPEPEEVPDGSKPFSEVFGFTPDWNNQDFPVRVYSGYEAHCPDPDPHYIFPQKQTAEAVLAMEMGLRVNFIGDAGSGKTSLAQQIAARTGRPFLRISYNSGVEIADIVGETQLKDGDTVFMMGDLPKFVQMPSVIIHDEHTRANAGIALGLFQRHLEDGCVKLQAAHTLEDSLVRPHPDVIICGADNTNGLGDETGMYVAANVQDVSTLNRWSVTIKIPYLNPEDMATLIKRHQPILHKNSCQKLAQFAALVQEGFRKGDIGLPFSVRNLLAIAALSYKMNSISRAIEINYLNALDTDSAAAVSTMIDTVWRKV